MRTIRVGSRESRLAIIQSEIVMAAIKRNHPEVRLELVTMKTTGDRILNKTLDKIGGKGLFVKELDEALRDGRVDICVHSYKDMPMEENPDLPVIATGMREDPRDVLILPLSRDSQGPAGCSSLRRRLQLERLYPDWCCEPVRGNVLTRIEKLDRGEYGGLILAAAGINRLGLQQRISKTFGIDEILPAACQGILAVQGREGEAHEYLQAFHDDDAWDAAVAERAFIHRLGGGCHSPVGAYAEIKGNEMLLHGMHVDLSGRIWKDCIAGNRKDGQKLGIMLAEDLRDRGD